MSDIEIGSVWVSKKNVSAILVVTDVSDSRVETHWYGDPDNKFEWLNDDFLSKYDLQQDMVNHPPHYKDASGIECIEVTKQGRKDDCAKRRYSLLPTGTVNHVVDVLEFGAIKYAPDNWQKVPDARRRYYDAAMRHIDAWFNGDLKDNETGLHHLAHAICCLMFLMWFDDEQ